jgi:hypothetical protein
MLYCGLSEKLEGDQISPRRNNLTSLPAIFASNLRWLAIASIPKLDGEYYNYGFIDGHPFIFIRDKFTYITLLTLNAYIYTVPITKFNQDLRFNYPNHQFLSYNPVRIIREEPINVLKELTLYQNLRIYYIENCVDNTKFY